MCVRTDPTLIDTHCCKMARKTGERSIGVSVCLSFIVRMITRCTHTTIIFDIVQIFFLSYFCGNFNHSQWSRRDTEGITILNTSEIAS